MRKRTLMLCGILLTCAITMAVLAQSGSSGSPAWQPNHQGIGFSQPAPNKQWVQLDSSPELNIHAVKMETLPVSFLINTGLHINSHTPKSQFLIPTALSLDAPTGVQIAKIEYPQGVDYHFSFAPKDPLSVYTGEFALGVEMRAKPGHYVLHGNLRYQACDDRACNPPKTLPVTLDLTAK